MQASDVLGTQEEQHELLFQDLLQMQYENVKTIKLFGVATVNVNLLIFLINKKFLNK
jgi:Ras GTPase-activating-like protein IQGAP2/3